MRRPTTHWNKGTLVTNKYSFQPDYGITTSRVEYHSLRNGGKVVEYVWVLWNSGEHCLFKIEMLEVVSEGG